MHFHSPFFLQYAYKRPAAWWLQAQLYRREGADSQCPLFLYENSIPVTASPFLSQRNISLYHFIPSEDFIFIFHTGIFIQKETSFSQKKSVSLEIMHISALWSVLLMNICNDNRTICDNTACSNTGFPRKDRVWQTTKRCGKPDQRTYLGKDPVLLTGYGPA